MPYKSRPLEYKKGQSTQIHNNSLTTILKLPAKFVQLPSIPQWREFLLKVSVSNHIVRALSHRQKLTVCS